MSRVELRGLGRSFGPVRAVDGVDLVLPQGSLTAVLGPSGCGKTTLLRLVAGFLSPDAGSILLDEVAVADPQRSTPPQQRRVGYVPQEGALFPHLDVTANIAFGLPRAVRRSAVAATRVRELLDLVELPAGFAERSPHELSGGQQQRVALARALAPEPRIVLLDEPFSSLDTSLRTSTAAAVARVLRSTGSTSLLVTHDQAEALSLADRVAVMSNGRLLQVAPPRELYAAPGTAEVAELVGGATVLPAEVRDGRATCALGRAPVQPGAVEGPGRVVVRPGQVEVREGGDDADVVEVSFLGHDALVRLRLVPDGTVLEARTDGAAAPAPGSRVTLVLRGPVHALPPEP